MCMQAASAFESLFECPVGPVRDFDHEKGRR